MPLPHLADRVTQSELQRRVKPELPDLYDQAHFLPPW